MFFGTGRETRDWININDAAELIYKFATNLNGWDIVNGASGKRTEIKEILNLLVSNFDSKVQVVFNGEARQGDPIYFWADVSRTKTYNWEPTISIEEGIKEYVSYFKSLKG